MALCPSIVVAAYWYRLLLWRLTPVVRIAGSTGLFSLLVALAALALLCSPAVCSILLLVFQNPADSYVLVHIVVPDRTSRSELLHSGIALFFVL
jgi:hypothetical protein